MVDDAGSKYKHSWEMTSIPKSVENVADVRF